MLSPSARPEFPTIDGPWKCSPESSPCWHFRSSCCATTPTQSDLQLRRRRGCHHFTMHRPTDQPSFTQLLLIKDAAELHASQVRHYHNGIYAGTKYLYYGPTSTGEPCSSSRAATTPKKASCPGRKTPFILARMAEIVWNRVITAPRPLPQGRRLDPPSVSTAPVSSAWHSFMEFHFEGDPVHIHQRRNRQGHSQQWDLFLPAQRRQMVFAAREVFLPVRQDGQRQDVSSRPGKADGISLELMLLRWSAW